MFIGRSKEIEKLNAFYESKEDKLAVVVGSCGMGKTTLLREFAQDKNAIYFTAYDTCDIDELVLLAKAMDIPDAEDTLGIMDEPQQALGLLLDEMTQRIQEEALLFVIDQYPAFAKAEASFAKTLYQYVTEEWKDLPVKLIFCGDAYLQMEKYVYGKKALWKNLIAEKMELGGLGFFDSREFYPEALHEEAVFLYGITGGIPALLEKVSESVEKSVKDICLQSPEESRYLPENVLSMELREMSYYNRILTCLAAGNHRVNQMSSMVRKPKDVVVPYLNSLMNIGVVTKDTAITEETNRKKTRYSIVNHGYEFWYRYIAPNMDLYYEGKADEMWHEQILPNIEVFMEGVFVDICSEYIMQQASRQALPFTLERMGNWWKNDDEKGTTEGFDLVGLGKSQGKSATIFVQCYYEEDPIEIPYLKALIEKSKQLRREGDIYYIICSRSGFHENALTVASAIKNIMLITLEDICS